MFFAGSEAAGSEADGLESCAGHKFIENVFAGSLKEMEGFLGCGVVSGLHEDIRHACAGPVGFEENWEVFAETGQYGVAGDDMFKVFELVDEFWGPGGHGNGLAVIGARERAEGVHMSFKVRNESVVESCEADEGTEQNASAW